MELSRREAVIAAGLAAGAVALEPENPVVGGTFLRRQAIRTPNYVLGVSGWTINQDGSAEFNNVTVRGTVIAGHFVGTGEGQEVLIYSGVPAAGNLIASICSAAGTDAQGNAFLAGEATYTFSGGLWQAISNNGAQILYFTAASSAGPWTENFALFQASTTQLLLSGIAGTLFLQFSQIILEIENNSLLLLDSRTTPGTPASGDYLYADSSGNPHFKLPSAFTGAIPGTQTDTTDRTVTQTVATQLGAAFTIPANDAVAGSVYEYTCGGTGTWGSTQQQLTLINSLAGTNVNQVNVAAAAFAASAPVDWELTFRITVKTTGAAGTCNVRLRLSISVNNAAALATNGITAVRKTAGVAINTTISNGVQLNALWASATGAPTITGNNTDYVRKGP